MDQVPLPLVIGLDDTWYKKASHGPVCFSQQGAGSKFFCSIKLCFYQGGIQKYITVVFGGTGRGIADFGKQFYEYYVLLFWKNKAWANRIVFLDWENKHTHQISADHHKKRMVPRRSYSYYKITWMIRYRNNTKIFVRRYIIPFVWYYYNEYTYDLDPSDASLYVPALRKSLTIAFPWDLFGSFFAYASLTSSAN